MAFRPFRAVKNGIKSSFNISSWIGTDPLKEGTASIIAVAKPLFKKEKQRPKESFEQAMKRLKLNENDLVEKSKGLIRQLYIYAAATVLAILYMSFLLYTAKFFLAFIALGIVAIALCKFYKSYYYYYQIQHRKLGCSFKECLHAMLRGNKK